jgi:alpha-amylase/alpha-mannosidase (GH57 family)
MPVSDVIVHGHFYQPPRENPFTGEIERQENAAPFHDWNERITAECYTPNTQSPVLDRDGQVVDKVNNFEYMSFNFGPTLLDYLQKQHPDTYRRILEADRQSALARGHGNAMAQCYNHMIMPLASARDRWTQIVWGLEDFRFRFGRRPEGMWLPETAVDSPTLDDLVRAGMKFVLLSPTQAKSIRPNDSARWQDVPEAGAPASRPYRCRTAHGDLAVLFYNRPLSQGVAFGHLLSNATNMAEQITREEGLVLVCNDGESYGHHEAHGDMCMAYLATRELPQRNMNLTNPAAFLAGNPPEWEVRLKPVSSWSCVHGVERWRKACGCKTGGEEGWNQAWRAPLRAGFDRLRERLDQIFERLGSDLLADPWKARDDYIHLILDKSEAAARAFFERHDRGGDRNKARLLLEMQHYAMLMYTSCAWFFSDISGLETTQNIGYALRAAQIGEKLAGKPVDQELRAELAKAKSNRPEIGSGLDILQRQAGQAKPATTGASL